MEGTRDWRLASLIDNRFISPHHKSVSQQDGAWRITVTVVRSIGTLIMTTQATIDVEVNGYPSGSASVKLGEKVIDVENSIKRTFSFTRGSLQKEESTSSAKFAFITLVEELISVGFDYRFFVLTSGIVSNSV